MTDIVDSLRQCLKANAGISGNVVLSAILDLIETFEYRPSRSTTGAVLDDIVSAIKARDRDR
jgi:hypothetical protein